MALMGVGVVAVGSKSHSELFADIRRLLPPPKHNGNASLITDKQLEWVAERLDALEEQLEAAHRNYQHGSWGAAERAARAADKNFRRVRELEEQLQAIREDYQVALVSAAEWKDQALAHQQQTIGQVAEIDALNEMCESLRAQRDDWSDEAARLQEQVESIVGSYVCENCGRLGPLSSFDDDCTPGWTHGRMIEVKAVTSNPASSPEEDA